MEGSQFRQFRGDRHRDMLTIGQGTLLHIRVLTDKGLQFKLGWLRVTTVKKKVILLDSALNQKGPRTLHGLRRRPQASQEILTPAAFQTDDLDAFDSDCDDVPSAKAILMANLSFYDSDVLSKVPFHDTNIENDMSSQSVQENQYSEQLFFNDTTEIDITSDSNIISNEQYL
ncbi:hypothetical protein Tco_1289597 [Tanacetum coccineum]